MYNVPGTRTYHKTHIVKAKLARVHHDEFTPRARVCTALPHVAPHDEIVDVGIHTRARAHFYTVNVDVILSLSIPLAVSANKRKCAISYSWILKEQDVTSQEVLKFLHSLLCPLLELRS